MTTPWFISDAVIGYPPRTIFILILNLYFLLMANAQNLKSA